LLALSLRPGALLHANRQFRQAIPAGVTQCIRRKIDVLVRSVAAIARIRRLAGSGAGAENLAVQRFPAAEDELELRGSSMGLDSFGRGSSIVVIVEQPARDPLSDETLHRRFGVSPQERRALRLLVSGRSNQQVDAALSIHPHTVRRHTEQVLQKLGVRSRAAVALHGLRGGGTP
jgi:DNA-binding CsgD family transcriptional regulator